jgi:hypothetical protein
MVLEARRSSRDQNQTAQPLQKGILMKKKEIDEFETLQGQLQAFHTEMNTLVKKSPKDALNKFKLGLVNSVLKKANTFLSKERQLLQTLRVLMRRRCIRQAMCSSSFLNT